MLSIEELLNPLDPTFNDDEDLQISIQQQRHAFPHDGLSVTDSIPRNSREEPSRDVKHKYPSTPAAKGPINFPPFEEVNEEAVREIIKYRIPQFGYIHRSCEHIPYNSSKRDFSSKTGREFIEAFRYTFQVPDQAPVYTVMWDYSIGLVRMTPFFKSMGYAKTKPSQALDKNPGLRDVCPSITGGAVLAQGYWMPFYCARALCATFCHGISGALIPLFGPDFPSDCTLPASPHFGDMMISKQLINEASEKGSKPPERQPATSRPASVPMTVPLSMPSLGTAQPHYDVNVTRKRHRDTREPDHKTSHSSMTMLSGLDTSVTDVAGLSRPDGEDCEEGHCSDKNQPDSSSSHTQKISTDQYCMTDNKRKRRKLIDELPSGEEMYIHKDRNICARRALPQSRGPVELKRRGTEKTCPEHEPDYSAASTLVQMGNEAGGEKQKSHTSSPMDNSASRRRRSV
ncbi:hypothetical protein C2857_006992 [Epichloe festucae Fl1]|uniref:HTH APSES-type domain-containing protein n=1 Tax=Epichloe festucae (strain Fl1) TaxID=877507 RepID=A0A7S9KM28_EPIFF|nr:hypothetical protein C2857_006992 [Epichloe festucae Fl1]